MQPTVDAFIAALRAHLPTLYPWAVADPVQADRFAERCRDAILQKRTAFIHDGPAIIHAWRAIGFKGRPTWKGLFALPQ